MEQILVNLIIKIGLGDQKQFLKLLSKLEYGVAIFCFKLSDLAKKENHNNLAQMLKQHATEEKKHGKMLSSLSGKKINLRHTGRWISYKNFDTGEEMAECPDPLESGKKIVLEKSRIVGIFSNLDGLSKRYFALKILFCNRSADSFSWVDRLALMLALEEKATKFYATLATVAPLPISAIALQISQDESHHSEYLKSCLHSFTPLTAIEIDKWRSRINWAMWGILIDMWRVKLW